MFDRFNRRIHYLRISVTDRCNLRCGYCMPAEGVTLVRREDILSFEEIEALVVKAVELGVDKVRLTGGEPLVRHGIVNLVRRLAGIPGVADFAMTSNGVLLKDYAVALREAGLRRLNISLDSMDAERFRRISRIGDLREVLEGIEAALQAGFERIKLNCVVEQSGEEPDARGVAEYALRHGLEVRFIRRMDLKNGQFWPISGGGGGHCESCSRLRVSSDGRIFPCLFSNISYSIRELGVEEALFRAVDNKPETGIRSDMGIHALGG